MLDAKDLETLDKDQLMKIIREQNSQLINLQVKNQHQLLHLPHQPINLQDHLQQLINRQVEESILAASS